MLKMFKYLEKAYIMSITSNMGSEMGSDIENSHTEVDAVKMKTAAEFDFKEELDKALNDGNLSKGELVDLGERYDADREVLKESFMDARSNEMLTVIATKLLEDNKTGEFENEFESDGNDAIEIDDWFGDKATQFTTDYAELADKFGIDSDAVLRKINELAPGRAELDFIDTASEGLVGASDAIVEGATEFTRLAGKGAVAVGEAAGEVYDFAEEKVNKLVEWDRKVSAVIEADVKEFAEGVTNDINNLPEDVASFLEDSEKFVHEVSAMTFAEAGEALVNDIEERITAGVNARIDEGEYLLAQVASGLEPLVELKDSVLLSATKEYNELINMKIGDAVIALRTKAESSIVPTAYASVIPQFQSAEKKVESTDTQLKLGAKLSVLEGKKDGFNGAISASNNLKDLLKNGAVKIGTLSSQQRDKYDMYVGKIIAGLGLMNDEGVKGVQKILDPTIKNPDGTVGSNFATQAIKYSQEQIAVVNSKIVKLNKPVDEKGKMYTVEKGDTLYTIVQKNFSDITTHGDRMKKIDEIVEKNKNIKNMNSVGKGWKIEL